jgi:hypothetical protein
MKLDQVEFVENKLLEIRKIISLEDAYQLCGDIIANAGDDLLEEHIDEMLKTMGYDKTCRNKVKKIIKEIQN